MHVGECVGLDLVGVEHLLDAFEADERLGGGVVMRAAPGLGESSWARGA